MTETEQRRRWWSFREQQPQAPRQEPPRPTPQDIYTTTAPFWRQQAAVQPGEALTWTILNDGMEELERQTYRQQSGHLYYVLANGDWVSAYEEPIHPALIVRSGL